VTPAELLDALWRDYTALTPQAARIHALFAARGERIVNDHVALRTFGRPGIDRFTLGRRFEALGWVKADDYRFDDKHLWASAWRHPDPELPKVFISELVIDELPPAIAAILDGLVAALPPGFTDRADLPYAGRPWTIAHATYRQLLEVSEYAAWVAAFGFRVNHFTVDVGSARDVRRAARGQRVPARRRLRAQPRRRARQGHARRSPRAVVDVRRADRGGVRRRHVRGAVLLLRVRAALPVAVGRALRGLRADLRRQAVPLDRRAAVARPAHGS
jgi:hypothetical protein